LPEESIDNLAVLGLGALWTLVVGGVGAWFGAYFKKKGENYATKEDLGELVRQMRELAKAQEEIKAEISDKMWDRQRRWELKRDVLVEAMRKAGVLVYKLSAIEGVYETSRSMEAMQSSDRMAVHAAKLHECNDATAEFDTVTCVAGIGCAGKVVRAKQELSLAVRERQLSVSNGRSDATDLAAGRLAGNLDAVTLAIREELEAGT
jgi:hypothetical protein